MSDSGRGNILVTGVTGYVGGRLVPMLLERGYQVRCLVRDASRLEGRDWKNIEIVDGNVLQYDSLLPALQNIDVAYYLIHSMSGGRGFQERDIAGALNFGYAAGEAGVKRIIYLGGLGQGSESLSPHLRSRQQTGASLRKAGVKVTEFRAAQIIGSGSASFELIRNMVERIPVIIASPLIQTRSQPIAIRDVLRYLLDSLQAPESEGMILEIGGQDILTYREMLEKYAAIRGLKRPIFESPLVTARFCALMADWVTPISGDMARLLLEGLKSEVIVSDDTAKKIFDFIPLSYEQAVSLALERIGAGQVATTWQDAYSAYRLSFQNTVKLTSLEGLITEKRQVAASADPDTAFKIILGLGGEEGWLYADCLWRLRGLLDRLLGGVGLRRGRRCPTALRVGDILGFWRVEDLKENSLLRLRSEMKMRSRAWLQFEIEPKEKGKIIIIQTAFYEPKGLLGLLYWYLLYPVHKMIFKGMIMTLAKHAESFAKRNDFLGF